MHRGGRLHEEQRPGLGGERAWLGLANPNPNPSPNPNPNPYPNQVREQGPSDVYETLREIHATAQARSPPG